jgi:hypothetical protein
MGIFDRWRHPKTDFAERDRLAAAIQRAIDELLAEGSITRKFAEEPEDGDDQYDGFCARAVQVYWRLAREPACRDPAADPDVAPYKLGKGADAHYWIRATNTGKVRDLNLGTTDSPDRWYPYHRGERRASFQPRRAGSKRTAQQ